MKTTRVSHVESGPIRFVKTLVLSPYFHKRRRFHKDDNKFDDTERIKGDDGSDVGVMQSRDNK